jgi:hypothetical protein
LTRTSTGALPVFESGKYLLAFDGAALLLLGLWSTEK